MRAKPLFVLVWLLVSAAPTFAQNARLPYRLLYNAQKTEQNLNQSYTNLVIMLTMQSTLPGVKPTDVDAYIDAKSGKIPIPIGSEGDFSVPLRDDLLAEDPWLITNQPKGTMKINSKIGVILGHLPNTVHYSRLMGPVRDGENVQEQMRRFFPGSPKLTMTGLKITFLTAKSPPVIVIHARGGDRKLVANQESEIILPLTPDLLDEDPEITFSETLGAVEIVSQVSR